MIAGEYISSVRQLIGKDDVKEAISRLHHLLEHSPKLNELLLQSARYSDILKQVRLGVVSFENANLTKNQIRTGLLELIDEIEDQAKKPEYRKELDQAISIINSKNVVVGSTISAGGDVQIGDKTIHTESKMSIGLRLFLFLFVPALAIVGAFLWYQNQVNSQPLQMNVGIENKTPNAELPDPVGTLSLAYDGEPVKYRKY